MNEQNLTPAEIILMQLGGSKFLAMTGANHLMSDGATLSMTLPKNKSKANRLKITLDIGTDTYSMRFFRYTAPRMNSKTMMFSSEKITEISKYDDVYCNQLQSIFTDVTGMYTHL